MKDGSVRKLYRTYCFVIKAGSVGTGKSKKKQQHGNRIKKKIKTVEWD